MQKAKGPPSAIAGSIPRVYWTPPLPPQAPQDRELQSRGPGWQMVGGGREFQALRILGRLALQVMVWLSGTGLPAQSIREDVDLGPIATREMFPLYLISLPYRPANPSPLGPGRWRIRLDHMQANTFEFSDVFKQQTPRDAQGRVKVTRAYVEAHAAEYAHLPLVFFFDEETAQTSLQIRRGITERLDAFLELSFSSLGGGYLDGAIEAFHKVGFEQFGRDRVLRDQITMVVMERGNLRFYSDRFVRGKPQDPVLGFVHRLHQEDRLTLALAVSLKPPLTTAYDVYQSGWDHSVALTGKWEPAPRERFYFGGGYIRRPRGNEAFREFPTGRVRDGIGAHFTWEHQAGGRLRPFVQLYWQSGYLHAQPSQKLDRPSLQHDLGLHWRFSGRTTLTFRYLNNITHNENTADMGIGFSLTHSF